MLHRVVITGMGAITPVGNSAPSTWEALKEGRSGIGKITRFDTNGYKVSVAAEVKGFEGEAYFGRAEARRLDLNVQYALVASDEAVSDANLENPGAVDPERFGVYVGSGVGGIGTYTENAYRVRDKGSHGASPFLVPAMIANMAAGSISIRHHAQGPTLPVVTACATSTNTIGEAFRAIHFGYADVILAGGTEACIIPTAIAGFTNCKALTTNPDPTTACRPFDAERNGFVMGEGACVLVLEDLDHALARHVKIYAEVVGYGNTADAYHITSPDPDAGGISRAIRLAIDEASLDPAEGLYINAHGTSTKLNDSSETLGIKKALGEEAAHAAHISSTKSMTGHMIGATGATEAMASALVLHEGVIPPTINYVTPDPMCDLDYTPNTAVEAEVEWALSTSLGFGGHNAVLALRRFER